MVIETRKFLCTTLLALLIAIVLSVGVSRAATYYMRADGGHAAVTSPEAHAQGPCSVSGDCLSIATHNDSTFSPGDTIYLCDTGGEYRGDGVNEWEFLKPPSSGSAGGGYITYTAASGDTPVINGSVVVEVGSWTYVNAATDYWYWTPPDIGEGGTAQIEPMQVWCNNTRLTYTDPLSGNGQWRWSAADTRVEIIPTDGILDQETIEVGQSARAINATNKQYIIVDGITVKKVAARGDYIGSPFDDSNGDFLAYSIYFGNFGGTCDHIIVRNCTVSQMGGRVYYDGSGGTTTDWSSGIELYNCDASSVYNNTVSDGHCAGMDIESPTISETTGYTVYNNTISSTDGVGLWIPSFGGSAYGNRIISCGKNHTLAAQRRSIHTGATCSLAVSIYNNYIEDSGNDGIRVDAKGATPNMQIYYNIINGYRRSGIAVVSNSDDVDVFNNTIYDADGVTDTTGAAIWIASSGNTDVVAKNNIIYVDGADARAINAPQGTADSNVIDYNVYYRATAGNMFTWDTSTITYANFATATTGWKAVSGQDANSYASDPLFKTTGTDFHLLSTSPAKDVGTNVSLTSDFDGQTVPYNTTQDIGALEWVPYNLMGVTFSGVTIQ